LIAVTKHNHPFDWFKLADYAAPLSLIDWAIMLSRREDWRETFLTFYPKAFYPDGAPEEERASFWHGYLAEVLPCNFGVGLELKGGITLPPPIVDITEKCSRGRTPISKFEMQIFGTRVLAVNPNAPDPVLKNHFENWLKEQRKRSPLPAKRAGTPTTNLKITNKHLSSWRKYNVLAVLDLDFCAEVFVTNNKRLTHEMLAGDFLKCRSKVDSKEWGRNARAKAKEAMQCRGLLEAQIQAETTPHEGGPK
jgi:hypothetical protein